jgi:hypothetical protein
MSQCSQAKNVEMKTRNDQIPNKVTSGQGLNKAGGARVAPDALLPVHALTLLVPKHDPQGEAVDEDALNHGDDVGVPVEPALTWELRIVLLCDKPGQDGRNGPKDDRVE